MRHTKKLSIVIPCTSVDDGLSTATRALDVLDSEVASSEAIVVVDGGGNDRPKFVDGRIKIVRLEALEGSYAARNRGASEASGEYILFLDSNVSIQISSMPEFREGSVIGATVGFITEPANAYEEWYQMFAFDQRRFLEQYGFTPTICMLVNKAAFIEAGRFDETLVSGGDMEFCWRFSRNGNREIELHTGWCVTTELRDRSALFRKIKRQVYGQVAARSRMGGSLAQLRAYTVLRIAGNLIASSFLPTVLRRASFGSWPRLVGVSFAISWYRVFHLARASVISIESVQRSSISSNLEEVTT